MIQMVLHKIGLDCIHLFLRVKLSNVWNLLSAPHYVIMTNYQTSWYGGYHKLFLFGNFTVRPSTGRLKNVSFIPSGQMAG
jgi:hypothetical protein